MEREAIFGGLNEDQRSAVEAVRGPVCIFAGAGSGKTTTITRRIANQVASGAFPPTAILAVTFTDRAAGEMRARLERLGVTGVRASTFHSAALAQLRHLSQEEVPQILPSKAPALRQIGNTLPKPYRFRPAGDLATEIEWAKNRRISSAAYLDNLGNHEPPMPADLMARVYERYETAKRKRNLIDFEDMLEFAIQMFQTDADARGRFEAKYHAFTVDEYQDVNLLQETLLREWVGVRDDLCVVGDDYQSIYGFTGATPTYLLDMPGRFPGTTVVRLETNYRSTPQVLDVANRLAPKLGGEEKVLRPAHGDGPAAAIRRFSTASGEIRYVINHISALHEQGVPYEQIAILYRVNFRSEDFEEPLAAAGIPYQVSDGAFLTRYAARQMLAAFNRSSSTDVAGEAHRLAEQAGYLDDPPDGLGEQEMTRQNDLARLIRLAEEFNDGHSTMRDFAADLQSRFGGDGGGRGVVLLTYHRAKGLEFEAVFLPRVEAGELPFRRAKSEQQIAEERRLFYVGITRAKMHLTITWADDGRRKASQFIPELLGAKAPPRALTHISPVEETVVAELGTAIKAAGGYTGRIVDIDKHGVLIGLSGGSDLAVSFGEVVECDGKSVHLAAPSSTPAEAAVIEELKRWRLARAKRDEVPAYVIFHDSTLQAIAAKHPIRLEELAKIRGIGPTKLERYGSEIIELLHESAAAPKRSGAGDARFGRRRPPNPMPVR